MSDAALGWLRLSPRRLHPVKLKPAAGLVQMGRTARNDPGADQLLDRRLRLAQVRGETERAAVDHDARLAGLGYRAARDRRLPHGPDRARRTGRGRVRPRAAVDPRVRLLG